MHTNVCNVHNVKDGHVMSVIHIYIDIVHICMHLQNFGLILTKESIELQRRPCHVYQVYLHLCNAHMYRNLAILTMTIPIPMQVDSCKYDNVCLSILLTFIQGMHICIYINLALICRILTMIFLFTGQYAASRG